MSAILTETPTDLSTTDPMISPALERLLWRCLEKDPARRFQSTSDLVFAFENTALHEKPPISPGAGEPLNPTRAAGQFPGARRTESTAPHPTPLTRWIPGKPLPRLVVTLAILALTGTAWWFLAHGLLPVRTPAKTSRAQTLYERGNYFARMGDFASLTNAIAKYKEAVELNPNFAKAYAALGGVYNQIGLTFEPAKGWDAKAFDVVGTALELDPHLPEALLTRGGIYFSPLHKWDAKKALEDLTQVVKLKPDLEDGYAQLGFVYFHFGLLDEAVAAFTQMLRINPDTDGGTGMGQALVYRGDYTNAKARFDAVPDQYYGDQKFRGGFKGICLFYLGQTNELASLLAKLLKEEPEEPLMTSLQAMLLASAGDTNQAKAKIQIALAGEAQFVHFHHVNYQIGAAYALMHEPESALHYIRLAADNGFPCYPYFTNDPSLKNLKDDPTFQTFLQEQERGWKNRKKELAKFLK